MGTNEFEAKLKKLSTEYIYNEAVGSLLLLLLSKMEDETEEGQIPYAIHPEILEIRDKITFYLLKLEDILSDKEEKLAALDDCLELKKQMIEIYGNIYRYFAAWNISSALLNDEVALRKYREENVSSKKIAFELFYTDCFEFLHSAETPQQQKQYMGQLFKCVPMKMARDKYFDLVKKSLENAFSGESETSIDIALKTFEESCAPESAKDYGKYFPEIAQWLSSKKDLKPSCLNDEDLNEEYTDFNSVFDTLNRIEDYFSRLFNDLHSLIILFYLSFDFEDLTEGEFAYADLYHSVCEILDGETDDLDKAVKADTLKTLLEEHVEPVIDKVNAINKEEFAMMDKVKSFESLEEDTAKTLASEGFVRSAYFADINEELFNFNIDASLPPAGNDFKEKRFEEFTEFMKEYFNNLPMLYRKSAMQTLLGSLPIAMDFDGIMAYIQNAMESAPSFEHKVLMVDKAGMVFTDNGFQYRTGNEADEEDGCDCGCGHEHHHHDDCGCGHEHHHHDDCDCGHEHHHH